MSMTEEMSMMPLQNKAVLTACLPGVSYPNGAVPGSRQ